MSDKPFMKMTIEVMDAETHAPPKGVPVIVCGGVAMLKTGGVWYSGMEEPLFQRPLEWTPKWWAAIPGDNVRPIVKPDPAQ